MKKILFYILSVIFLLVLSACAGQHQQAVGQPETEEVTTVIVPETTEPQLIEVTTFNGSFEMQDAYGNTYITADDIKSAKAEVVGAPDSMYNIILIEFNEEGTQEFADATEKLLGENINIIVDGETICSPIVNAQITDGKIQIEGDFTLEEVNKILLKMQG